MQELVIDIADEAATRALGARLGAALRPGDAVLLSGPLGAGKSVLARAAIAARTPEPEAASPTFGLAHSYDADGFEIWHFDLYRINDPAELDELGLDDAIDLGAALIEWAEKAGPERLPEEWLLIRLEPQEGRRKALLRWTPAWESRIATIAAKAATMRVNRGSA